MRRILVPLFTLLLTTTAHSQSGLEMPGTYSQGTVPGGSPYPAPQPAPTYSQPLQQPQTAQPVGAPTPYAPAGSILSPVVAAPGQLPPVPTGGQQQPVGVTNFPQALVPLKSRQTAWKSAVDSIKQVTGGVVRYDYDPLTIMPVRIRPFAPLTIVLPPGEQIRTDRRVITVGSSFLVAEATTTNSVELRTTEFDYDTTLKIQGESGNLYVFFVSAVETNHPVKTEVLVYVNASLGIPAGRPVTAEPTPTATRGAMPGPSLQAAANKPQPPAIPLSPALQSVIPPNTPVRVPHVIYEKTAGDYAAIGPKRVIETPEFTIFDFGEDAGSRPRPVISHLYDQVDRPTLNLYGVQGHPELVIADRKGSFTLRYEGRLICVIATADDYAGLKPVQAEP